MVTKVIRRTARPEREDEPVTPSAAPPKRGWVNLRGECVAEMRRWGVDPRETEIQTARVEWRSGT